MPTPPADAVRSPDGKQWWDGTAWQPIDEVAPPTAPSSTVETPQTSTSSTETALTASRSRQLWPLLGAALIVVVAVAVIAANSKHTATAGPNGTIVSASSSPTPYVGQGPPTQNPFTNAPTPEANQVGVTISTTDGTSYQVIQYVDHFRSTNQFDTPPPGGFFAAIHVKECASASATLDANEFDWRLVEPDDSQLRPGFIAGGQTPEFNATTVQPGKCLSGWVNFSVTAKPKQVVVDNSDLSWNVP